jgi:hypothetical protein
MKLTKEIKAVRNEDAKKIIPLWISRNIFH